MEVCGSPQQSLQGRHSERPDIFLNARNGSRSVRRDGRHCMFGISEMTMSPDSWVACGVWKIGRWLAGRPRLSDRRTVWSGRCDASQRLRSPTPPISAAMLLRPATLKVSTNETQSIQYIANGTSACRLSALATLVISNTTFSRASIDRGATVAYRWGGQSGRNVGWHRIRPGGAFEPR